MSATFIHDGEYLDHTPSADLAVGAVVVLAAAIGIATRAIPANTLGALAVMGVFEVPRDPSGAIAQGAMLFWDATAERATTDADSGANKYLGISAAASANAATKIRVRLNH